MTREDRVQPFLGLGLSRHTDAGLKLASIRRDKTERHHRVELAEALTQAGVDHRELRAPLVDRKRKVAQSRLIGGDASIKTRDDLLARSFARLDLLRDRRGSPCVLLHHSRDRAVSARAEAGDAGGGDLTGRFFAQIGASRTNCGIDERCARGGGAPRADIGAERLAVLPELEIARILQREARISRGKQTGADGEDRADRAKSVVFGPIALKNLVIEAKRRR